MPLYEGLSFADKNSVVFEIGNAYTKCGFVNEYSPRAIIRSEFLNEENGEVMKLMEIKEFRTLVKVLKCFIEQLYFRYLAVNPKDRKVVLLETIFSLSKFRKALAEVFFNHFNVPSLLILPQHLMSLMTLMIPSALVVDIGYWDCYTAPVIEGVTLMDSVHFAPFGGFSIEKNILSGLKERKAKLKGYDGIREFGEIDTLDEKILENIKIRTCFVAPYNRKIELEKVLSEKEESIGKCPRDVIYPLNGELTLFIPGIIRELSTEICFQRCHHEDTLPSLILDSLVKCPVDSRKMLASNIVLIGGTSMIPGLKHRLLDELKNLVKSDNRYKGKLFIEEFKFHELPCKENYAAWLGATIYASTDAISRAFQRDHYIKNGIDDWTDFWPADQ